MEAKKKKKKKTKEWHTETQAGLDMWVVLSGVAFVAKPVEKKLSVGAEEKEEHINTFVRCVLDVLEE